MKMFHVLGFIVLSMIVCTHCLPTSQAQAEVNADGLIVQNGWYSQDGNVIWGYIQHNGWWRAGQRPNLTRRAPVDGNVNNYTNLDVRPNRTEDLDALTDNMERYGYPGFEHNYGLWFDRRRDAHDTVQRTNPNVVAPFLEQPWARSGIGTAWDGLSKYDLTQFNDWYFQRLADFADYSDDKGTVLFHNSYMQHALLEAQTHYVDFPWRPENNINNTGMPSSMPAANAFYDISNPVRANLHRLYIRKTLDELGANTNVVYLPSQEYTGPRDFVEFWMDTITDWETETGKQVHIGLGATKDVLDAVLADPVRGPEIDTIDLRYWWIQPDGSLYAPAGGIEVPGRYAGGNATATPSSAKTTSERIYEQVRQYRDSYPDKAIIHAIESTRQQTWAFFMGGGSMLIHGQIEYPGSPDVPPDYIAPPDWTIVRPLYELLGNHLANRILSMKPDDLIQLNPQKNWSVSENDSTYLAYTLEGQTIQLDLSATASSFNAQWFDPRTGTLVDVSSTPVAGGAVRSFAPPSQTDWALVLHKVGSSWGKPTQKVSESEFNTSGDQEGWVSNAGVANLGVANGKWNLGMLGADPYLTGPVEADPIENAFILEIAMSSNDSDTLGQIFWQGADDTFFSEDRSRKFTVLNDGQIHRYWFDLTNDFDMGDAIRQLRLDPVSNGNGGIVTIDYMRVLAPELPGDANLDGVVDDKDASVVAMNWLTQSGATWFEGDFNHDGKVDEKDATIMAANWQLGVSASTSVPEPCICALLTGILLMVKLRVPVNRY